MSTLIQEYAAKEAQLKKLQDALHSLESDPRFAQEFEFKNKLEALMTEFDKTPAAVLALLDPERKPTTTKAPRKARKLKIYKNPQTGEVIETKGANHKKLKAWKEQHGAEKVDSWLQEER